MPALKSVQLGPETWHTSRVFAAEPGELELSLEGMLVHVRLVGANAKYTSLRTRFGTHFALREWDTIVYEDAPPKKAG